MQKVEALKAEIHAAVEAAQSQALLEQIAAMLHAKPQHGLTPQQEAGIARGIADFEAGRTLSLHEFKERGVRERQERILRYGTQK